ncbi:hypothetical protein [Edaphobacter sp. HDX4]|uniref:hypothetical protein n=1 Tax=Edaphobacter sp. HDX4 TaxID=2794064 RepID=UPI002FE5DFA0
MNLAALNENVTFAAWRSKPSWQIRTLQDLAIPLDEQKFEADRAHSHVTEVNSSHAVTISNADIVADVIEQAARAAAKYRGLLSDGAIAGVGSAVARRVIFGKTGDTRTEIRFGSGPRLGLCFEHPLRRALAKARRLS